MSSVSTGVATGLTIGGVLLGAAFGMGVYMLNDISETYDKETEQLRNEYNDLVAEWNERVARQGKSPNKKWKHYNNPHAGPDVNVCRQKDVVDKDGTRHRVYKDLISGASFTILGG